MVGDDSGRSALPVEREDDWFLVHEIAVPERTIVMSNEVKNAPQLRTGLTSEILSERNIYQDGTCSLEILPVDHSSAARRRDMLDWNSLSAGNLLQPSFNK
jgi:hypothetical protein